MVKDLARRSILGARPVLASERSRSSAFPLTEHSFWRSFCRAGSDHQQVADSIAGWRDPRRMMHPFPFLMDPGAADET